MSQPTPCQLRSRCPADTMSIADKLAKVCIPGDFILLTGELGAGKTVFTKGFARSLGFDGLVTSPTFTLVQEYRGRMNILHADLYRLESLAEFDDLALGEQTNLAGAVALVEWGELAKPSLRTQYLEISLRVLQDDWRLVTISGSSASWDSRVQSIDFGSLKVDDSLQERELLRN